MKRAALVVIVPLALSIGCTRPSEEAVEPLETEEVTTAIDAELTTDYDLQASSVEDNVGVSVPGDFPRDLPLYASGSVISYGPADPDRKYIELSVPAQLRVVERRYEREIVSAGWRKRDDGAFERNGRAVWVSYREGTPGTWVRIEYPA